METINIRTGREIESSMSPGMYKATQATLLSEEMFDSYDSSRQNWATQAKDDEDFRNGAQWSQSAKAILAKRRQAPVVTNVIKPAIETGKAILTANKPRFSSAAQEDSDVRTGKMFSELMTVVWNNSDGDVLHKLVIDDYYVKGMGVWNVFFDPNSDFGKGEIRLRSENPFDVYFDPNAKDIFCRDASSILLVTILTGEQIQANLPDYWKGILNYAETTEEDHQPQSARYGAEGQTDGFTDARHNKYRAIERYTKVLVDYHRVTKISDGTEYIMLPEEYEKFMQRQAYVVMGQNSTEFVIDEAAAAETGRLYQQTGGVFHYIQNQMDGSTTMAPGPEDETSVPGSTYQIEPVTMEELMKQGVLEDVVYPQVRVLRHLSVGSFECFQEVLPISQYPIIPVMNHFNRTPYPMSDVRFVRPIQEYINKLQSLVVTHAANSANIKALLPLGSVKRKEFDEEMNKAGTAAVYYNAESGSPHLMQPIPLPNELYHNIEQAKMDIERILGIYEMQQGASQQAPDSYRGTLVLDEMQQRRVKAKQNDIEAALIQVARVVVEMIQAYYTAPRVTRILEPNMQPRQLEINTPIYDSLGEEVISRINDVTVGKYDITVVSGSMLPNNRWARFDYYKQLYELGVIDDIELLKQTEVVDLEGVLNRSSRMKKMMDQIQMLTEENKRLKGDLQTAQRESVQDRKRVVVEKFKTELNQKRADTTAVARIFEARLGDELKQQRGLTNEMGGIVDEQQEPTLME